MKMSQTTRILLLLVLIVAAVAVWYALFFTGKQQQKVASAAVAIPRRETTTRVHESKPAAVTTSARALQVLPIPFLITETPEEAPLETAQHAKVPALAEATVPPNPFVPLRIKTTEPPQKPPAVPESKKPVLVTPQPELTTNNIPVPKTMTPNEGVSAPPPVSLGQGALPIKLSPLAREVSGIEPLQQAVAENNPPEPKKQESTEVATTAKSPATDNGESEQKPTDSESSEPPQPPPPPPNPLAVWAAQENLRLDGVALGPVGVAIFKTANGYLALPVGQTFPDKNILVKTITAERVLLVDSSGNNTLTLELGGGE